MASTEKEQIRVQMEELLRRLHPDALVEGGNVGFSEVDFFLEQCVVTTRHGEESTERRVIAIISAEWARFAQNFDYHVCSGWFGWHDMMNQAKAALRAKNRPENEIEDEAKKLVKSELIRRHGKAAYDAARDTAAFLVKDADWKRIDALAKSICDKFQIQPDQLTFLMVAGSQNHSPSPQVQGLCRHGHELRFCLVDDMEQAARRYFYEKDITQKAAVQLNQNPNQPKPKLRELLRAEPVIIGVAKSIPIDLQDLQVLNPEKSANINDLTDCNLKIITWNVGTSRNAAGPIWDLDVFKKTLIDSDADVIFLQEVDFKDSFGLNFDSIKKTFENKYHVKKPINDIDYGLVTLLKKNSKNTEIDSFVIVEFDGIPRVFAIWDNTRIYINVHLEADDINGNSKLDVRFCQCIKIGEWIKKNRFAKGLCIGGDFNENKIEYNKVNQNFEDNHNRQIQGIEDLVSRINSCASARLKISNNYHELSRLYWPSGKLEAKEVDYILLEKESGAYCWFNDPNPISYNNVHFPVTNINNRKIEITVEESHTYYYEIPLKPDIMIRGNDMTNAEIIADYPYKETWESNDGKITMYLKYNGSLAIFKKELLGKWKHVKVIGL
jgi:exonuclease III